MADLAATDLVARNARQEPVAGSCRCHAHRESGLAGQTAFGGQAAGPALRHDGLPFAEANLVETLGKQAGHARLVPFGRGSSDACVPGAVPVGPIERTLTNPGNRQGRKRPVGRPAYQGVYPAPPRPKRVWEPLAPPASFITSTTVNQLMSGGRAANHSIATDESYINTQTGERVDKTEWHRIVIFQDGHIDMFEKHAQKGRLVNLDGTPQARRSTEDVASVLLSEEIGRPINTHERPIRSASGSPPIGLCSAPEPVIPSAVIATDALVCAVP